MSARMTAAELVRATAGRYLSGAALSMVETVCTDSRQARPGSFFVPLPGARQDGHLFIEDAFSKGAIGACLQTASGYRDRIRKKYPLKVLIEVNDTLTAFGEISRFWRQKLRITVAAVIGDTSETVARLAGHIAGRTLCAHTILAPPGERLGLERGLLELSGRSRAAIVALGPAGHESCERHLAISDPDIVAVCGARPAGCQAPCPLPQDIGARHIIIASAKDARTLRRARQAGAGILTFGTTSADVRISESATRSGTKTLCTLTINGAGIPLQTSGQQTTADILGTAAVCHALGLSLEEITAGLHTA